MNITAQRHSLRRQVERNSHNAVDYIAVYAVIINPWHAV